MTDTTFIDVPTKPSFIPGFKGNSDKARAAINRRWDMERARNEVLSKEATVNTSHESKIRGLLSRSLLLHAQTLVKQKHKLDLKQTVETASLLFGWDSKSQGRPLLQIGMVEKLDVK